MANWPSYSTTRSPYVGYSYCAPKLWRLVSLDWNGGGTRRDAPAVIGPHYTSKAELLADLGRYLDENYAKAA